MNGSSALTMSLLNTSGICMASSTWSKRWIM